ncbi:hypothetical protein D3H55_04970 [Bacillus salacetis]|uniref:Uncharacterized protein n=1 Tax=Bacillus salacetis TaxID=2315464 RepID=A0A3A1R3T9_9BACI|nr:hypothetical protein [Bacillus salacetis]RIW37388.1 hypothetical protein D3H55_04970 [Bacillus salacetis]
MYVLPLMTFLFLTVLLFFFFQRKSFSFVENSILFILFTILITNVTTILTLNLDLIRRTDNPFLFPAYLLYRNGILPLLLLIFINMVHSGFSLTVKIVNAVLIFIGLNGLAVLLVSTRMMTFIDWNYAETAALNAVYLLAGLGFGKLAFLISQRSPKHDHHL